GPRRRRASHRGRAAPRTTGREGTGPAGGQGPGAAGNQEGRLGRLRHAEAPVRRGGVRESPGLRRGGEGAMGAADAVREKRLPGDAQEEGSYRVGKLPRGQLVRRAVRTE